MKKETFRAWASLSDEILSRANNNAILANPLLNPLRSHPALRMYSKSPYSHHENVGRKSIGSFGLIRRATIIPQLFCNFGSKVKRANLSREPPQDRLRVLFVSHRLPGDDEPPKVDRYFGSLPDAFDSFVLYIDHRNLLGSLRDCKKVSEKRLTIPPYLSARVEFLLFLEALLGAIKLRVIQRQSSNLESRHLIGDAIKHSLRARTGLRIGRAVRIACEIFQPSVLVVTFEGHSWERLSFRAARKAIPNIVALGYPHAGILPEAHSLFRCLGPELDPDGLLAPGEIALREIEMRIPKMPVGLLGSPRYLHIDTNQQRKKPICLVLPEGFESEVERLVGFTLDLSRRCLDIEFRVRLHPILDGNRSLGSLLRSIEVAPNVKISRTSLAEDAKEAIWCLYRGSTSVVAAVTANVFPIYLHSDDDVVIDPLLASWGQKGRPYHAVKSIDDALRILRAENPRVAHDYRSEASSYFSPMNHRELSNLVGRLTNNSRV